jgi:hypothetical protein
MARGAGSRRRHLLFWLRIRLRRNLRYVVTFALVLAFVLVLGLWVRMYDGSSGGAVAQGGASTNDPFASLTEGAASPASPAPTRARSSTGATPTPTLPASGAPKTLPRVTITPAVAGGFTYANVPTHKLVMRVTSSGAIPGLGYLVPTSQDHSYGKVLHPGRSWSVTTSVTGKPYYAAVFVQADGTGAAITCTITIDGKLASRKTTAGGYGRQVCIA